MERTEEELKRLLVGRKVSVRREGMECTEGKEFTVRNVVTEFHIAVLIGWGDGESGYVRMCDVDGFLDGQECTFGNVAARLLPADAAPTEAIVVREPGDGGEAINEYFRREGAKGRTEEEITKDFLEGPEVAIENGEYRWVDGAKQEEPAEQPTDEKEEELRKALLGRCVLLQKDGTAQEVWGLSVTNSGGVVLKTDAGHFMLPNKAALEIFLDGGRAKCVPVIPKSEQDVFKDCCLLPEGWKPLKSKPTEQLAELDAGVQQLQAATEFFAKEPERTYTTAEVVSVLGALRSAMATTREQSEPAKPAMTGKWEERWWQVYLRYFMDERTMSRAAEEADKVVAFARKHLEGE